MRENAGKMRARIIPNTDTFYVVPIKMDFLSTNWPVYVIIMIRNQRKLIPLKAKWMGCQFSTKAEQNLQIEKELKFEVKK